MAEPESFVCECGKSFKKLSGLNSHKHFCKGKPNENEEAQPAQEEKPRKRKFTSLSNDIKWMYVQMGGRDQLLVEAQNDPKFFKMLVEVMLKDEQRVKEISSGKGDDKGNTFFIIKGLQTEDKSAEDIAQEVKQLRASMLPEEKQYQEEEYVPDEQIEEDNG